MRGVAVAIVICTTALLTSCRSGASSGGRDDNTASRISGTYRWSSGFAGGTLQLAPNGRYRRPWRGCFGWDEEEGEYGIRNGGVVLWPNAGGYDLEAETLRIVHWGDRLYLVDDYEKAEFCDAVNLGREPRRGNRSFGCGYLRIGDDTKDAPGLPEVPSEWKDLLLAAPQEGKVIELRERGLAVIDIGSQHGLRKDMPLVAWCGPRHDQIPVRVMSLDAGTAVVSDMGDPEIHLEIPKLAVGDRVFTRDPRAVPAGGGR